MKHSEQGHKTDCIDIRHASVSLEGAKILTDISWRLREGEHWAILGGNGAGKSTFLKLVRGDLWPDPDGRGRRTYRFDGKAQESPVDIRERIAFVSPERQDAYARNGWDLSGEEVIFTGFFDSVWLQDKPGYEQRAYAEQVVRLLRLSDLRDKSILAMSEGEARKVFIARALVSRPRVLMLDEFCSGLDFPSRRKLLHLVERIAGSGTQIIFTTHRAEELIPSISDVLFLKEGKVLLQGKRGSVFTPEHIAEALGYPVRRRIRPPLRPAGLSGERDLFRKDRCLVDIRNVDVYLGGKKILDDIRWKMRSDENWAVLGRNGAGKSTLLKIVLGDIHPALGGTISWFGKEEDISEVRNRIGYLSSELQGSYDSDLTGEEVVLSGFFSSIGLYRNVTEKQKKIAERWIRFFGLEPLRGKRIFTMSYGELRKMLLTRAVVNSPDILILDEPCSGLDMGAREELLAALERLSETGTRLVMVTHHPEDLIPSITHLLVVEGGKILRKGRREKIIRDGSLSTLFAGLGPSPFRWQFPFQQTCRRACPGGDRR
jgi:molybdate transport system ATP-binding protein